MAEVKQTLNRKKPTNANGTVPLSDIFFMTLRYWPWIILSVALCFGVAYIYLLRTPNVYTRSAELLIKDDSKGKTVGAEEFTDLGLFQSNTNIQNEMTNLRAKDLMEEVVKRLGLDVDYYSEGRFHDIVAYGYDLPVKVTLKDFPDESSLTFDLNVDNKGRVTIKNLSEANKPTVGKVFAGNINDSIQTPVGKIVVTATPVYTKGEIVDLAVQKRPLTVARDSYNSRLSVSMSNEKGTVLKLTLSDLSV